MAGPPCMRPAGWGTFRWWNDLTRAAVQWIDARDPTHQSTPLGWAAFDPFIGTPPAPITPASSIVSLPRGPTSPRRATAKASHCYKWLREIRTCKRRCAVWVLGSSAHAFQNFGPPPKATISPLENLISPLRRCAMIFWRRRVSSAARFGRRSHTADCEVARRERRSVPGFSRSFIEPA